MLFRIVVGSKVRGEKRVLMVRLIVRVFLQKYMDCLEKNCVSLIGDFVYLLALWEIHGMLSVATGVGVVDQLFWKIFKVDFYDEILCLL